MSAETKENPDQEIANSIVSQILYIKDPRTGLHFVFYDHRLTCIPESVIPRELLIVANVDNIKKSPEKGG